MRLFLAVEIAQPMRTALGALQEALKDSWPGWRWVRPEGIHLTLRFLGEVGEDLDARSRAAWRAAAEPVGPFEIRLGELGRFPRGGNARVLWLGVEETAAGSRLRTLAARVEQAARSQGFEAEKRPWRPHLTLARGARGARPHWCEGPGMKNCPVQAVKALVLFRSQLHPAGARYTALDRFMLRGLDE